MLPYGEAGHEDEELLKALAEYCAKINEFYGRDFGITKDDETDGVRDGGFGSTDRK